MILFVVGGTSTGKTSLARNLTQVLTNAQVYDDMTVSDIEEQIGAIQNTVIHIGMAVVIVKAGENTVKKSARLHAVLRTIKDLYHVSVVEAVPFID